MSACDESNPYTCRLNRVFVEMQEGINTRSKFGNDFGTPLSFTMMARASFCRETIERAFSFVSNSLSGLQERRGWGKWNHEPQSNCNAHVLTALFHLLALVRRRSHHFDSPSENSTKFPSYNSLFLTILHKNNENRKKRVSKTRRQILARTHPLHTSPPQKRFEFAFSLNFSLTQGYRLYSYWRILH